MRFVKHTSIMLGIVLVIIVSVTIFQPSFSAFMPTAQQGVIDLREWENANSAIVKLDGSWRFYRQHFTHSKPGYDAEYVDAAFIQVPGDWKHAEYGTYQLTLLISEELKDKSLGLYIPSVATAYSLWIDDEYQLSNGTIAPVIEEVIPVNYARTVYFEPRDTTIELTIEVANFVQRKGGLWEAIHIGLADDIALLKEKRIAIELSIVGALFMMGIYNIFIYFLRRRIIYPLYLGVLCLLFAARTLLIGETFMIRLFPAFPWELQVKVEYLPIVVGVYLLVKYVNHAYPMSRLRYFEKVVAVISLVFALVVLATPAKVYTQYLSLFVAVILACLGYIGYAFWRAYQEKRVAASFTFFCYNLLILSTINDALYFMNVIHTGSFLSAGFLFFLTSQTFVHAVRFSEANMQVERLSKNLKELNLSLEKKVDERTVELSGLYERLQGLYAKLSKSEDERKRLMSDIAHEISTPLTLIKGYSEALVDQKLPLDAKYIEIIHANAITTERLIQDLSDLSKLESRQMKMEFKEVKVKDYPAYVYEHHKALAEKGGHDFQWVNREQWNEAAPYDKFIVIDEVRMNQVFTNIIHNAVKYTPKEKSIYFAVEWKQNEGLIFKIRDEGKGIASEAVPHIFNRLYRKEALEENQHRDTGNRGLGLTISKEIIDIHGGKIWVDSVVGQGSTFYISIPSKS